jgi:phenylacetate-CoA ligase
MIFKEKIETMDKEEMKNLQSERLVEMVNYVYKNSSFYKKQFDDSDVSITEIKTIDDIKKLPFTTKDHMRDTYPYGIFSDKDNLAEIHVSSGTTGNPTLVGYTKEDIALWGDVMARGLACAGARPGDILQNAYGYGLFTGGLGMHYGAFELGMTVIPMSAGQTKRQLKIMQDFKPRVIASTPSYSLYMAEEAKEMGLDPRESSWEVGVFGAEPWSDKMREEVENIWNMDAIDTYGLSEIIGPGVAQECIHRKGLHVWSDVFYPEVINPETGEDVPEGENGELVFTTFTKKGIPLVRYRTKDIVSISYDTCECGRTAPRISKIKGRTDDMVVIRGINVFPSQIEHVLLGIEGTKPHYQLVVDRSKKNLDTLEVQVEVEENMFSDEIKKLRELEERIRSEIYAVLSISAKVKLVEPNAIPRSMGKAVRIIDKRNI